MEYNEALELKVWSITNTPVVLVHWGEWISPCFFGREFTVCVMPIFACMIEIPCFVVKTIILKNTYQKVLILLDYRKEFYLGG